jgi:hypothetical protein
MFDEATLAQINGAYSMPSDAGPAWREAHQAGIDMGLIETSLRLTPAQRLQEHQRALNFVLELQESRLHDSGS